MRLGRRKQPQFPSKSQGSVSPAAGSLLKLKGIRDRIRTIFLQLNGLLNGKLQKMKRRRLSKALESNLAKDLRVIHYIDPKFLKESPVNFVEKVKASMASYQGMRTLPENFNFGILVVFDAHKTSAGKVVKGFRKNVFLQSRHNPGKIDILDIVENSNGSISLNPVPKKAYSRILSSAGNFALHAMHQK